MVDAAYSANVAFIEAVERLHGSATKPITEEQLMKLGDDIRQIRTAYSRLLDVFGVSGDKDDRAIIYLD